MVTKKVVEKIEDALLASAGEKAFLDIRLSEIADRAGVDLAELRRAFDGPFAILESFCRRIDVRVLETDDPSLAGESSRERLFDALMRRFDLLVPYRAGIAGLERAARRDPVLACHLARLACGSQTWLLESAGISTAGLIGRLRAPVLAAALVRLVPVFLADEEAGLPKTMAALDETLDRLGDWQNRVARVLTSAARWTRRGGPSAEEAEGSGI
ncbi:MAG: TetR/AcrR family transcriptional regulator [Siculibacillus sp.]|nr:TetR/AcrR family transcriptional regulator [Siculibacillus sp.]